MMAGGGITTCGPAKTLPFWPDIRCTCPPPKSLYLVTMSPTTHRPSICLLTRRFVSVLPHLVSVQRIELHSKTHFSSPRLSVLTCLTCLQRALWEQQDPADRKLPFVPRKYSSLRQVPAFSHFIHERFERCLDLYLCPRQRKMRVTFLSLSYYLKLELPF